MKQQVPPAVIAGALAVILVVAGFFLLRVATAGPQVQGVDSMPPSVRQAFMGPNKSHQSPQKP